MPDSNIPPSQAKTTGIARAVQQLDDLGANRPQPIDSAPVDAPYVKEPLFSKKVIAAWAGATLVIWFVISFIAPAVKESIKTAIVSSMEESGTNTAGKTTVIRTRNGRTITIDENGVTIKREDRQGPVVPPIKVVIPAPPGEPAPAPEAKKAAEAPAPRR